MASYRNSKLPPNLEKPPLFSSGYRAGGFESNKSVNFTCLSALSRVGSGTSVLGGPLNDFKVPKVESELCFNSDSELPSFKRPKFSDETQQLQIHSFTRRDLPAVPLFASQVLPVNVQNEDMHVQNESEPQDTKERTVDLENHFNPLSEPSPLGLNLRKSPSLLDLIQRKLTQCDEDGSDGLDQAGRLSKLGSSVSSGEKDKLKAANFPASKLRIGTWECTSRYDGDLVAKCYYAKRKLVWEVLDSGLKSKMEVQWSDISALKAVFPDDQCAVLDIELSRPPLFFREINPQPRKHTLWQSTSDFTDGQATICRHHSVQFPVGVLNRHFEKLLQCDARLKALHEQTHSIQDSCCFDNRSIQIDRQHMLHYQSVLSDHAALQPLTMNDDSLLQPAAARTVDCSQTHRSAQAFQSEPLQHFSPHHGGQENIINARMEGFRNEPLQRGDQFHNDMGPSADFRHRQGGFQLQFAAAASPSSVIDSRGLNESSSSSEAEEPLPVEIHSEPLNLHVAQDSCRFSPGSALHLNDWPSRRVHEGAIVWNRENRPSSFPMNPASEKQALNELSLHLLGESIATTEQGHYSLGRPISQGVHETFANNGSSHVQQLNFTSALRDLVYKQDKNVGNLHHGPLVSGELLMKVRDSQWNAMLEHRAFEGGPSSLASHGSFGELVYLPRIASQPQFLEPGP